MVHFEKMTILKDRGDFGKIDLLVSKGFYSSRDDFVQSAIQNQLLTDDLTEIFEELSVAMGGNLVSQYGTWYRLA